jgi:hypothetical protein
VELLRVRVLVVVLALRVAAVIEKPPVLRVAAESIDIDKERVNALPRVTVPGLIITLLSVFPLVVNVPVAVSVNVPVYVKLCPATKVTLPATDMLAVPVSVPVNPVQLIDLAPVLPDAIVQVTAPDAALKNTSSAVVGTD